jgi:RNA polymerase sigma-70 factor (ECF subfamily)
MSELVTTVPTNTSGSTMATEAPALLSMDRFLATVERRAYAMAYTALRDRDEAMDVVQDAMLRLVRHYRHKAPSDWLPLFYRILNNRINDGFRARTAHRRLFGWFGNATAEDATTPDPLDQIVDPAPDTPTDRHEQERRVSALQKAVGALPRRQREAFMLRCWEGLSAEDTARAMACTQGSVKTHYFRALQSLREQLEEFRP